ncbi:MAG: hypothetical protein LBM94_06275 [Propionibacteriaceae bacterium]|jgi:methionine-rich copper-binding protein CopC|nr:hypothetical protein [Propionibacteriaceae bacterium]
MNRNFWSRESVWKAITIVVAVIALAVVALLATKQLAAHTLGSTTPPSASQPVRATPRAIEMTPGQPPAGYSGDASELQVRQNGNQLEFSPDGGKTWSKEMPSDSGMSVNVQVVED